MKRAGKVPSKLGVDVRQRLHRIRLSGAEAAVDDEIERSLIGSKLLRRVEDVVMVTRLGKEMDNDWFRLSEDSPEFHDLQRAYGQFLLLNERVLTLCSRWQVTRAGIPNDRSDVEEDFKILSDLHETLQRVTNVIGSCALEVDRFGKHFSLLAGALDRAFARDHRYVASPVVDSFHTVWMRLHEEMICALGRSRDDEPPDM